MIGSSLRHDLSSVDSGARADVNHPIGSHDGLLVMFNHDDRIAGIPQSLQRMDEPAVVVVVQPDAGLVENVENIDELRTDLGCKSDPLAFAA